MVAIIIGIMVFSMVGTAALFIRYKDGYRDAQANRRIKSDDAYYLDGYAEGSKPKEKRK